jgi:hypothetical protein
VTSRRHTQDPGEPVNAGKSRPVAAKAAAIDAAQARPLTWKAVVKRALTVAVAGAASFPCWPGRSPTCCSATATDGQSRAAPRRASPTPPHSPAYVTASLQPHPRRRARWVDWPDARRRQMRATRCDRSHRSVADRRNSTGRTSSPHRCMSPGPSGTQASSGA